jgi:cell wall-associated NlpC family hydrolase
MATPIEAFKAKLGVGNPTAAPKVMSQSPSDNGQAFIDRLMQRKTVGQNFYANLRQKQTNRVATDLVNKSAGLKFDEFGKPEIKLADFGTVGQSTVKGITQRGNLVTQQAEARNAFRDAVRMQDIGSYGLTGQFTVSGTDIPGASSNNVGARAASMAMQVAKNNVPYVWGGNNLATGVDCSGLVQQIYRQLGIQVPRVTYDQAKNGKVVSPSQIRPGDLVFYRPGSRGPEHVGIYVGNGKIVHAANTRLGVITSNLNNSNGAPMLVLRPY